MITGLRLFNVLALPVKQPLFLLHSGDATPYENHPYSAQWQHNTKRNTQRIISK